MCPVSNELTSDFYWKASILQETQGKVYIVMIQLPDLPTKIATVGQNHTPAIVSSEHRAKSIKRGILGQYPAGTKVNIMSADLENIKQLGNVQTREVK